MFPFYHPTEYKTLPDRDPWIMPMMPAKTVYDIRLECMGKLDRAAFASEVEYFAAVERLTQFIMTGKPDAGSQA